MNIYRRPREIPLTAFTAVILGVYLFLDGHRGYYSHDEGQAGLVGIMALEGKLPHRDFTELYTGFLSIIHGYLFSWFGTDTAFLRLPLWVALLTSYSMLAQTLSKLMGRAVGGLAVLLTFTCTTISYFGPLPFPLFTPITIICICLMHQWAITQNILIVCVVGFIIGSGFLIKTTSLYLFAATFQAIVIIDLMRGASSASLFSPVKARCLKIITILASLLPIIPGLALTLRIPLHEKIIVGGPLILVLVRTVSLLIDSNAKKHCVISLTAGKTILALCVTSGLPVIGLLLYYAMNGALHQLFEGLFVLPLYRFDGARLPIPSDYRALLRLCTVGIYLASIWTGLEVLDSILQGKREIWNYSTRTMARVWFLTTALAFYLAITFTPSQAIIGPSLLFLIGVPLSCYLRVGRASDQLGFRQYSEREYFDTMLITYGAFLWLAMVPTASDLYATLLAAPFVLRSFIHRKIGPRQINRSWIIVLLLVAVGQAAYFGTFWRDAIFSGSLLHPNRAQLKGDSSNAELYRRICDKIHLLSSPHDLIFAGPDAPEVAYLCSRQPYDDVLYDFFASATHPDRYEKLLKDEKVRVVVLKLAPPFSPMYPESYVKALGQRFPNAELVSDGKQVVEVRWR